jgi:hypothetical protein
VEDLIGFKQSYCGKITVFSKRLLIATATVLNDQLNYQMERSEKVVSFILSGFGGLRSIFAGCVDFSDFGDSK